MVRQCVRLLVLGGGLLGWSSAVLAAVPSTGPSKPVSGPRNVATALPDVPVSNVPGAEHGVIYEQDGVYACFPSLTDFGDGRIVTEFGTRVRPSHVDFRGGTKKMMTTDGGTTWTPFEGPIVRAVWKAADGSLVDANADGWFHVDASRLSELKRDRKFIAENAGPGQVAYLGGAHFRVSTDQGKTWVTHSIPVPDDISGLMHFHDDVNQLRTSEGVRLTAVYGPRKSTGVDEVFFLRSPDDGKTWAFEPMFPNGLPDHKLGFNETSIIQLSGGDVLAMMRSNPADYLYRSISKDQGLTWSAPEKTAIWGVPCQVIELPDHRLLCVYGYRRSPMGVRACMSSDGGKTWDIAHEMILRADGRGGVSDIGYPRVLRLADGKLLAVYYIATDGTNQRVHIAWTRWSIPSDLSTLAR